MRFRDREEGGHLLARELEAFRGERPIVLALPPGGVPVACEIAIELGADLAVLLVRRDGTVERIGGPPPGAVLGKRELETGRDACALRALAERQPAALAGRLREARAGRATAALRGATAILVDDLVATGERVRAAALIARKRGAAKVVVAAPVIARGAERVVGSAADVIACLYSVPGVPSIREWYERIEHVSDEDVVSYLDRALRARTPAGLEGELWNGEWIGPEPREEPERRRGGA
ncbi:phosphoribosyltransferase family protein [Anaeromyxobacter oryzae]|uniref:Phosphoribosyltransferase n=1 Tax=Anaeromyxobacter oryzae TaxID=2918170 RepID=A0ABM7WS16_9BACT|nr:phosphoribosyltransferase family protein [Anaeromyxobacter oryzae]BDG02276.1 phosphoribosyltransferase [Anaeromyxobacter oryzae]